MGNVSRPLIGLLVATVLFFALWLVALKPSSSPNGTSQGLGHFQSAINQAKASVASQNAAAASANATSAGSTPSAATAASPTAAASPASAAKKSASSTAAAKPTAATLPAAHHAATARKAPTSTARPAATVSTATATQRRSLVERALATHKVLALLVYNPAGADDLAVKRELRTIPTHHGRVVKLAIPVGEITRYPVITNQVPIQASPTLVVVDSTGQAFTLVGFADGFEIAQRIDDALSMR